MSLLMGDASGCAESAQAHWQSNSRHDGCSWLWQLKKKKKKDLNIYKGDKRDWRKSRQEENETQITFLNNRNLQKTFSSAKLSFSFVFLLTATLRKCLGVKSNKSQPCCVSEAIFSSVTRISLAVLPATGQFPLQFSPYTAKTKNILISTSFFASFCNYLKQQCLLLQLSWGMPDLLKLVPLSKL